MPIKELLLALAIALKAPSMLRRLAELGGTAPLALHGTLLVLLVALLIAAAYPPRTTVRWTYALVLGFMAFYLDAFERITGDHMSYDAFITMWDSAGFAGETLQQHARDMVIPLAKALVLAVAIGLPPRRRPVGPLVAAGAPWLGTLVLAGALYAQGGEGAQGLPGAYVTMAYTTLHLGEIAAHQAGARQPVTLPRPDGRPQGDVVLIIDESVGANYLDLNAPDGVTSGLLHPPTGITVHSFGAAASITNCSAGTNQTLRFGGTRDGYQRINATMPSLWAYAHAAGRRTVYLDAQRTGGRLQNQMTEDERREIDTFVQFDTVPLQTHDMAVADRLASHLANDTAEFILVNKVGAHFPVHDKYPDAYARYQPALPRETAWRMADVGMPDAERASINWPQYRNAYRNTLTWNVGAFFARLLASGSLGHATIIYTADHGQNLHERGGTSLATHCNRQPVMEEGAVPLVVLEDAAHASMPWARATAMHRDQASHYQIFPTLLRLMGYDSAAVRQQYGASLADSVRDPHTFNARFNARLGQPPVWVPVKAAELVHPPIADTGGTTNARPSGH